MTVEISGWAEGMSPLERKLRVKSSIDDLVAEVRSTLVDPAEAKRVREELGISLRRLAEALGVDPSALFRWENGTARPRRGHARAWGEAIRRLSELLDGPVPSLNADSTVEDAFAGNQRISNALRRQGIQTLAELAKYSEAELRALRNFGALSLDEVRRVIRDAGLQFAPDIDLEYPPAVGWCSAKTGPNGRHGCDLPALRGSEFCRLHGRPPEIGAGA